MISYSVLVAAVVVSFALGILVGRRDERRRSGGSAPYGGPTRGKRIDVPPLPDSPSTPKAPPIPASDAAADPELREHLARGQMISAIKRYRELTGVGLREAKEAVEALRGPQ